MVDAATEPIRIIVVDDHPLALLGLRVGLCRFEGIRIEHEATDGASGSRWIAECRPDAAIIDVALPDTDGIEVARQAKRDSPGTRLILSSGALPATTVMRGLRCGVDGFFQKSEPISRLADLIQGIVRGDPLSIPADQPDPRRGMTELAGKEQSMLMLLATGASLKQAAARLGMSYKSADYLKQSVMRKLDLHDRIELIRYALRTQLVAEADDLATIEALLEAADGSDAFL